MKQFKGNKITNAILAVIITAIAYPAFAAESTTSNKLKEDQTEIIEVTGIRSSLARAQFIKRNADSVVDVISVEDLGKFSDESVADSLSRVPGVQIERNDDGRDGARVAIRGLGSQFTTTTLNGRTVFSGGAEGTRQLRSFSYDTLPAEVFNEIIVRKTPTADHIEAGIAGQVNIKTLVPLQASPLKDQNFYASVSATAQNHSFAGNGEKYTLFLGGQNAGRTLGWYGAFLSSDIATGTQGNEWERATSDLTVKIGNETYENVRAPEAISLENIYEEQERTAFSGAIQWQLSNEFSLIADVIYSDYVRDNFRSRTQIITTGAFGGGAVFAEGAAQVKQDEFGKNHLVFADFGQVTYDAGKETEPKACPRGDDGSVTGCPRGINAQQVPLVFDHQTETLTAGIKADWQINDKLDVEADVYLSKVEFEQDLFATIINNRIPNFTTDSRGSGSAIYSFAADEGLGIEPGLGAVTNNPYTSLGLAGFGRTFGFEADHYGVALDFDYDFEWGAIESIEFGARYTETKYSRYTLVGVANAPATGQQAVINGAFSHNAIENNFYGVPLQGFDEVGLRNALNNADLATNPAINDRVNRNEVLADNRNVTEETIAFYVEANGFTEAMGLPTSFNVGLRIVDNNYVADGPEIVNGGPGSIKGGSNLIFLPSFNLNTALSDDLNFRVGLGRSISLPEVEDLVSPISVTAETCNPITQPGTCPPPLRQGSAGNPDLDPMSAWTLDFTLEWYTANDGTLVLSYFYKNIKDFVRRDTFIRDLPAPANDSISKEGELVSTLVSGPINFSDGTLNGFEIGFNQPLTIISDSLEGFGLQANYTFVDSSFEKNVGDAGLGFPGSSENNFNAIAYYETDSFGARVTYTYRSDFLADLNAATITSPLAEAQFAEGWGQVNASVNYDFNDHVSLRLIANDIFESERRDFVGSKTAFRAYYQRGRTVAATVTAKF